MTGKQWKRFRNCKDYKIIIINITIIITIIIIHIFTTD